MSSAGTEVFANDGRWVLHRPPWCCADMRIDRCVCDRVTFAALKDVAVRHDCRTVCALAKHVRFGTGCGYCKPYVRDMLRTGETVYSRLLSPDSHEDRPDPDAAPVDGGSCNAGASSGERDRTAP
ncbi:MAG: (2Fe-2S)-binding protein [Rhodothermales bacterium]